MKKEIRYWCCNTVAEKRENSDAIWYHCNICQKNYYPIISPTPVQKTEKPKTTIHTLREQFCRFCPHFLKMTESHDSEKRCHNVLGARRLGCIIFESEVIRLEREELTERLEKIEAKLRVLESQRHTHGPPFIVSSGSGGAFRLKN